jgi:hypothetical protein
MAQNGKVGHFRGNNSYKGSPYNFIQMKTFDELDYICIVVAQDLQVSDSGSREPLVLEPSFEKFLDLRLDNS